MFWTPSYKKKNVQQAKKIYIFKNPNSESQANWFKMGDAPKEISISQRKM